MTKCTRVNCLLLALHQRRLGRTACLPPELFELLCYAFADAPDSLMRLCHTGNLPTLQNWHNLFGVDVCPWATYKAFEAACAGGHLFVVQWVHAVLGCDETLIVTLGNRPMRLACVHNQLATAQWLHATYGHLTSVKFLGQTLPVACSHASQDLIAWLWHAHKDTHRSRNLLGKCLYHACSGGRLSVAKWLLRTLPGSRRTSELCEWFQCYLQVVCRNGFLDMLQWLKRRFKWPISVLRAKDDAAMRNACMYGHVHIVEWLVAVTLPSPQHRAAFHASKYVALASNHPAVVNWLTHTFGLDERTSAQ